MGWAVLREGGKVFMVRVAGVAVSDGRVLLHRSQDEAFWSLPGGRLQVGETAGEALVREMREEIGAEAEVGGLLWVIENFFEHRPLDTIPAPGEGPIPHHEIGLYLEMALPARFSRTDTFMGSELAGTVHEFALEFHWFPQAEMADLDVRPTVLRERLAGPLPTPGITIVQRATADPGSAGS